MVNVPRALMVMFCCSPSFISMTNGLADVPDPDDTPVGLVTFTVFVADLPDPSFAVHLITALPMAFPVTVQVFPLELMLTLEDPDWMDHVTLSSVAVLGLTVAVKVVVELKLDNGIDVLPEMVMDVTLTADAAETVKVKAASSMTSTDPSSMTRRFAVQVPVAASESALRVNPLDETDV